MSYYKYILTKKNLERLYPLRKKAFNSCRAKITKEANKLKWRVKLAKLNKNQKTEFALRLAQIKKIRNKELRKEMMKNFNTWKKYAFSDTRKIIKYMIAASAHCYYDYFTFKHFKTRMKNNSMLLKKLLENNKKWKLNLTPTAKIRSYVEWKKKGIITETKKNFCTKSLTKVYFGDVKYRFSCVKSSDKIKLRRCVKWSLSSRGQVRCVKKINIYGIPTCRWFWRGRCRRARVIFPKFRCLKTFRDFSICKEAKYYKPIKYCHIYRIINGKKLCSYEKYFFGLKYHKMVCLIKSKKHGCMNQIPKLLLKYRTMNPKFYPPVGIGYFYYKLRTKYE